MNIQRMSGYTALFSLCLLCLFILAAPPANSANMFRLKPGARGATCLKCHENLKEVLKRGYVHPLVKKRDCTGCHVPHTSSHKGLLIAATTKLCFNCHQNVLPEKRRSAHDAVVEGKCTICHASHGSDNRYILKKAGSELCFGCHQNMSTELNKVRFRHRSLDKGKGCLNCHNPHASAKSNYLLQREPPSLCNKCHQVEKLTFKRTHKDYPVAHKNCISCHNPHGSNTRGIVFDVAHAAVTKRKCTECHEAAPSLKTKQKASELCRKCHRRTVDLALDKNRVHWPLLDNVGCLNCHGPHATKEKNLLRDSVVNVCGTCHEDTVQLQEWSIKNNERLCEPVKKGNCIDCHSPHAGDEALLFTQESINSGLCGRCHQWESHSTHPIGDKVVDQRDRNLTLDCLSCHKACGTNNNKSMLTFSTTYELCIQCHVERRR